jgi:hypothetical protein
MPIEIYLNTLKNIKKGNCNLGYMYTALVLGVVVHIYNLRYSGGAGRRTMVQGQPSKNTKERHYLQK